MGSFTNGSGDQNSAPFSPQGEGVGVSSGEIAYILARLDS
jgi:hypothetical protein